MSRPKRQPVVVPLEQKMLLSVEETAAFLGIGRDAVYDLIKDRNPDTGKPWLHSAMVLGRRKIPRDSLNRFVALLADASGDIDAVRRTVTL